MDQVTYDSDRDFRKSFLAQLWDRLRENQLLMAIAVALLLFIVGGLINSSFLKPANIGNLLAMSVLLGLAATGQTLVVVAGGEGIDLSIGAVMSLGAIISVQVMRGANINILPALGLVVFAGTLIGLFNAAGIIITRVPPLVMTLAMANVVTTVQLIYTGGTPDGFPAPLIAMIGTGRILPFLPWLVILGLVAVLLMHFLLNRTVFGKQLFSVGNNFNAAFLSGVRVNVVRGLAYVLSGLLSAIAGLWLAAYTNFTYVNIGGVYTLPAVAAVVIGGTSLAGGKGNYVGSMVGAIVLTVLSSMLIMLKTDEAGRQIINGVVLIILLAAYTRQPTIRQ